MNSPMHSRTNEPRRARADDLQIGARHGLCDCTTMAHPARRAAVPDRVPRDTPDDRRARARLRAPPGSRWRSHSPPESPRRRCGSARSASSIAAYCRRSITCFGLSILLRADSLWVHPLAAALAISAKFVIRFHGKHLYNPANLGVILAISLFPGAWISPGQWGQDVALAGWFVVLGGVVVNRAQRSDIAWVFLAAYLGLVALRVHGARPAVDHFAASVQQRRPAALRVLHDLGSDDDPERRERARRLRDRRRASSRSCGTSRCSSRTGSCGRCSSARRWCRSSTGCGRRKNSNGG